MACSCEASQSSRGWAEAGTAAGSGTVVDMAGSEAG